MDLLDLDYDSSEYMTNWLTAAWPSIAASCYAGFLRDGPGVMYVDFENAEPTEHFLAGLKAPTAYKLPAHLRIEGLSERLPEMMRQIETYDPAVRALFLFRRRLRAGFHFMGVQSKPTPKELFAYRQEKLREAPELRWRNYAAG